MIALGLYTYPIEKLSKLTTSNWHSGAPLFKMIDNDFSVPVQTLYVFPLRTAGSLERLNAIEWRH